MGSAGGESPKSTQLEGWTIRQRMKSTFIIIVPISPQRKWGYYSDTDDGLFSIFTEGRIHGSRLWKQPLGHLKKLYKNRDLWGFSLETRLTMKWAPKTCTKENHMALFSQKNTGQDSPLALIGSSGAQLSSAHSFLPCAPIKEEWAPLLRGSYWEQSWLRWRHSTNCRANQNGKE